MVRKSIFTLPSLFLDSPSFRGPDARRTEQAADAAAKASKHATRLSSLKNARFWHASLSLPAYICISVIPFPFPLRRVFFNRCVYANSSAVGFPLLFTFVLFPFSRRDALWGESVFPQECTLHLKEAYIDVRHSLSFSSYPFPLRHIFGARAAAVERRPCVAPVLTVRRTARSTSHFAFITFCREPYHHFPLIIGRTDPLVATLTEPVPPAPSVMGGPRSNVSTAGFPVTKVLS